MGENEFPLDCSKLQIHFETTGCRLNQIESESAGRIFSDLGFSVGFTHLTSFSCVDFETVVAIINTCAVTKKAEQKDRRIIRMVLDKCPNAAVIVTGCYAQLARDEILCIDKRIALLPGQLKSRIGEVIPVLKDELSANTFCPYVFASKLNNTLFSVPALRPGFSENAFKLFTDSFKLHTRPSIKIQDGCNSACSYCTIHIARGYSVSLEAKKVIEQIQKLEHEGYSEVVFTTVNVGQYSSLYNGVKVNFTELLKLCLDNSKKICFRLSSLYPEVITERFCEVVKDKRVRPHFHISVQSGSDKILKSMGRSYTGNDLILACKMLRKAKENPFIGCDIITGFPGELNEDFENTMDLCKKCDFSWVHVFPYSERPGTLAASMKGKVPNNISTERAKRLGEWAFQNKKKYISSYEGKKIPAIVEKVKNPSKVLNTGDKNLYHAVSENFLHCEFYYSGRKFNAGECIDLYIKKPKDKVLKGGEIDTIAEFI